MEDWNLGYRVQGIGFLLADNDLGLRSRVSLLRITGVGFRIQGVGFRIKGLGFRYQGVGFKI